MSLYLIIFLIVAGFVILIAGLKLLKRTLDRYQDPFTGKNIEYLGDLNKIRVTTPDGSTAEFLVNQRTRRFVADNPQEATDLFKANLQKDENSFRFDSQGQAFDDLPEFRFETFNSAEAKLYKRFLDNAGEWPREHYINQFTELGSK